MSYHKLPTKTRIFLVSIPTVAIYVYLALQMNTFFPELTIEEKRKFSQIGLIIIFSSGLFAGLGFMWSSKARHNLELARSEINSANVNIELLNRINSELDLDYSDQIQKNEQMLSNAQDKEIEVNNFPSFLNFAGIVSLLFLGLGTLLCIVGEG